MLKQNKYLKKLFKIEDPEQLGIRFKRHPKSKKFSEEQGFQWESLRSGTIEIPVCNKSIVPIDDEKQFYFYTHEVGHIKRGHYRTEHPCHHRFDACLPEELEAELNIVESLKKIGEKFEEHSWSKNLRNNTRFYCKSCLKTIKAGECPQSEIKRIEKHLNIIDKATKVDSRRIFFPEQGVEKEHQMILKILLESDPRMKKLIENENIEEKGIKFVKHPESEKFYDTPKTTIWRWNVFRDKRILIPLDKNNSIIPYNKDDRIFNAAHEFGHIELDIFSRPYECGRNFRACLFVELKAHTLGIKRLQKINVQFDKMFWRGQLLNKWFSCEDCLKILNRGKCPKKEREKIKKSLSSILRSIRR